MSRLLERVRRFAAARRLHAAPGVVAVSGGADSVALLRGLLDAGCGPLAVAHLNHRLRGAESDADEAFVAELAARLGCAHRARRADAAALAEGEGSNLEATARRARYDWVAEVAAETGAGWAATGHTADDRAETVLHRLVRGTGLRGLRAIAEVRPLGGGPSLVRPLLSASRAEVVAYLESIGQPFRQDASNADPRFTRNRIRHELLPLLRTFNPEVASALGALAAQAAEAFGVLDRAAAALLAEAERPRAGPALVFDAGALAAAAPYLAREALRAAWAREGWPMGRMTAGHWQRLLDVARGEPPAADFPGGASARRVGRVVRLRRGT